MNRKTVFSCMKYLIRIGLTLFLLIYFVGLVDFDGLKMFIFKSDIEYFFLAFIIQTAARVIAAVKFHIILNHFNIYIRIFRIFLINWSALIYSAILPGDVFTAGVKILKLAKGNKAYPEITGTLFFVRIADFFVTFIIGLAALSVNNPFPDLPLNKISIFLAIVIFIGYSLLFTHDVYGKISRVLQFIFLKNLPSIKNAVIHFLDAFSRVYRLRVRKILQIHLLSIIHFLTECSAVYLLALGLHIQIDFYIIIWLRSIVLVLRLLPISLFGAGLREGLFVYALGFYGYETVQSLSLALLVTTFVALFIILGGFIELFEINTQRRTKTLPDKVSP